MSRLFPIFVALFAPPLIEDSDVITIAWSIGTSVTKTRSTTSNVKLSCGTFNYEELAAFYLFRHCCFDWFVG